MKQGIHPNWYNSAKVICACGASFVTGSTIPEIRVEICSNCHPFYTGSQKLVDTEGQVEKFSKKNAVSKAKKAEREKVLQERATKVQTDRAEKPSLKDLLMQARKKITS